MKTGKALSLMLLLAATQANATVYKAPAPDQSLIGQVQYVYGGFGDTAATVALKYDIGYNSLESANPQVDVARSGLTGAHLQLATQHLLPDLPRKGIVVNLPEMRMYYYPEGSNEVHTFPIGIGKIGKTIPIANTDITRKVENPQWSPPEDIRQFNLAQGIILPKIMPAGPDNPLGPYAIYMSVPTYLMHSTIFPESVGKRASFGCLRMYESDMKELFASVTPGIPVVIVNSPVKLNWNQDRLFIEAYEPMEEHGNEPGTTLPSIVSMIQAKAAKKDVLVDWQAVSFISKERDGLPHDIGIRI